MAEPGWIVILNGAPRSGKSSIARALQSDPDRSWMNLGVDAVMAMTPPALVPGIGLRPGGERPDLEDHVQRTFRWLYDAVAGLSRGGTDVVVDVGHHDSYSRPLGTLIDAAHRLDGLPALLVGVRCPLEEIMRRRDADGPLDGRYVGSGPDGAVPEPVRRWQTEVHRPGVYDLEIDTGVAPPEDCAARITDRLGDGTAPAALAALRDGVGS